MMNYCDCILVMIRLDSCLSIFKDERKVPSATQNDKKYVILKRNDRRELLFRDLSEPIIMIMGMY